MPGVQIEYRPSVIGPDHKAIITATIRRYGSETFSAPENELSGGKFNVKYLVPDDGDELTCDVIVRIPLHHYPSRLEHTDKKALGLAEAIMSALADAGCTDALTIGVSLGVHEIGWGMSVLDAGSLRALGRRALLEERWGDAEACGGMGESWPHHVGTD